MLEPRTVYKIKENDNDSDTYTMSVDEILKEYKIKGLSLGDLQEKYVDDVDAYEEKISELEDTIEDLKEEKNGQVQSLEEQIQELKTSVGEISYTPSNSYDESYYVSKPTFYFILLITIIIAFIIGKKFNNNQTNKTE